MEWDIYIDEMSKLRKGAYIVLLGILLSKCSGKPLQNRRERIILEIMAFISVPKDFLTPIPTDCYALCALTIRKHSKSASFEALSHVLRVPKSCYFMQA